MLVPYKLKTICGPVEWFNWFMTRSLEAELTSMDVGRLEGTLDRHVEDDWVRSAASICTLCYPRFHSRHHLPVVTSDYVVSDEDSTAARSKWELRSSNFTKNIHVKEVFDRHSTKKCCGRRIVCKQKAVMATVTFFGALNRNILNVHLLRNSCRNESLWQSKESGGNSHVPIVNCCQSKRKQRSPRANRL